MNRPVISVLMAVYNCEEYLDQAVQSILEQTFTDFEFLIVDDGSTDGSLAILKEFAKKDPRVRLVSRPNKGLVASLNEMLELANGDYIARMDADDVSISNRFERQVHFLQNNPSYSLVGSRVCVIDPEGLPIVELGHIESHEDLVHGLLHRKGQLIFHPAVMMRAETVRSVGGYNLKYWTVQDADLFLRLSHVSKICNLPDVLLKYREHFRKIGRKFTKEQQKLLDDLLREHWETRGLEVPKDLLFGDREENEAVVDIEMCWAWWALNANNLRTARKYARRVLLRRPWSVASWRLAYCALRGN